MQNSGSVRVYKWFSLSTICFLKTWVSFNQGLGGRTLLHLIQPFTNRLNKPRLFDVCPSKRIFPFRLFSSITADDKYFDQAAERVFVLPVFSILYYLVIWDNWLRFDIFENIIVLKLRLGHDFYWGTDKIYISLLFCVYTILAFKWFNVV